MIKEAHDVLMDIHSPTRPKDSKELAKELLAQVRRIVKINDCLCDCCSLYIGYQSSS